MDLAASSAPAAIAALFEILMIDIVLAGDNAIVVGALAAGLPAEQRKKVILIGVHRRACAADRLRARRQPAPADRRPGSRRRDPSAVGRMEDVPRDPSQGRKRRLRRGRRRRAFRPKAGQDLRQRCVGRRARRRQYEPRQRPCRRWSGAGAPVCARLRPDPFGAADGRGREYHRALHRSLSLDRVGRPAGDPVGRDRR